jgi:hypothetical protein
MATPNSAQDFPIRDDLTGRWSYTSFLLDASNSNPGEDKVAMPTSVARIWAQGTLDLTETPQSGESDTLTGTLQFGSGLAL